MPKITNDRILVLFLASSEDGLPLSERLVFVRGLDSVFEFVGSWYRLLPAKGIAEKLYAFLLLLKGSDPDASNLNVTNSLVLSLVSELMIMLPRKVDDVDSGGYMTFADDKVFDFSDFSVGPPSLSKLSFFKVPVRSDELGKDCPKFLSFLSQVLVDKDSLAPDSALAGLVQLLFGYVLLPSMEAQSAFFLVGDRAANGKSTLTDVLLELVGKDFVSSVTLQELSGNRFAVPCLLGKRLNLGEEEESKFVSGATFKKLVSGDLVSGEIKYGGRVTFRNRAKFVFTTNEVPTFSHVDNGLLRRLLFIPFHRSFTDDPSRRPRSELLAELKSELPGILAWAVEGARRLVSLKFVFPRPPAVLDAMREFEMGESSAFEFIHENFEIGPNFLGEYSNDRLFNWYVNWTVGQQGKPMRALRFHKEIVRRFERDGLRSVRRNDLRLKSGLRPLPGSYVAQTILDYVPPPQKPF